MPDRTGYRRPQRLQTSSPSSRRTAPRSTGQASNAMTRGSNAATGAPESMTLASLAGSATRPSSIMVAAIWLAFLGSVSLGSRLHRRCGREFVCAIARVPAGDRIGSNSEIEFGPEGFVEVGRLQRNQLERVLPTRDSNDVPPFQMRLLPAVEDQRRVMIVGHDHFNDRLF